MYDSLTLLTVLEKVQGNRVMPQNSIRQMGELVSEKKKSYQKWPKKEII